MTGTKTVLIAGGGTGGHLMPALAIAEALRTRHPDWRIVLAGAIRGVESRLLPERTFPFHLLPFEPIYRRQWWWKNLKWPLLGIRLIRLVRGLLDHERPDLVLGTGGYASGPIVWAAARRGIPTAILEQDAFPGLVTRANVMPNFASVSENTRDMTSGASDEPPMPSSRQCVTPAFCVCPAKARMSSRAARDV